LVLQNQPSDADNVPIKRFETKSLAVRRIGGCRDGIYLRARAAKGTGTWLPALSHHQGGLVMTAILKTLPTDTLASRFMAIFAALAVAIIAAFITTLEGVDTRRASNVTQPGTIGLAKPHVPLDRAPGRAYTQLAVYFATARGFEYIPMCQVATLSSPYVVHDSTSPHDRRLRSCTGSPERRNWEAP
jgi:hypothetical protein